MTSKIYPFTPIKLLKPKPRQDLRASLHDLALAVANLFVLHPRNVARPRAEGGAAPAFDVAEAMPNPAKLAQKPTHDAEAGSHRIAWYSDERPDLQLPSLSYCVIDELVWEVVLTPTRDWSTKFLGAMKNDDWLNLQMRTLSERVERFAEMLRSQLSVAETLFEEAQAWFSSSNREVRPTDTARAKTSASEAPESSQPTSSSVHGEDAMRGVDEILAEAQKALDSSIRAAFSAGQRQVASDLRRKMEALFEGLAESDRAHSGDIAPASPSSDHEHRE